VAIEADLSAQARTKLAKARRVLGRMQATVAFFWTMIAARLIAWGYDLTVQQWMRQELIPAYYLPRVAQKAGTAQERQRLWTLAAEVLARARSPGGPAQLCRAAHGRQQRGRPILRHRADRCFRIGFSGRQLREASVNGVRRHPGGRLPSYGIS